MRKIYSGASQYIPGPAAAQLIHSGPGKIYSIIATTTSTTPTTIALYDTLTTGNQLFGCAVIAGAPVIIHFPQNTPIVFETGLVATVNNTVLLFLITEAET